MVNKLASSSKLTSFKKNSFSLFLILYFVILIYLSWKVYIWEDEAYSLNTSSHSLPEVIKLSYLFEGQPPFYFVLLSIWRLINQSIFFARLLSVIFIALSAVFFYRLVLIISGKSGSHWLVFIFLLNPFTVWAALEIRLYALVIFLSLLALYSFFKYYIENKNKYLYFFLAICLIGLYTQYFFSFFIFACALSIWKFKGWKAFLKFCLFLIPLVVLFLVNLKFLSGQMLMAESHVDDYTTIKRILAPAYTPQNFILGLQMVPLERRWRWFIKIIFTIIACLAFFKFYRRNSKYKSFQERLNIILLTIAIMMILYSILVSTFSLIYQDKYMAIAFPLFILLFSIFKIFSLSIRRIIYTMISLYFIIILAIHYRYPTKTYDFKAVANFILDIGKEKEPVLFYSKSILPPFEYYYSGNNKLIALPPIIYDSHYYDESITDTSQLIQAIKMESPSTKTYLLVTGSIIGFNYDTPMTKEMIDTSLKAHYNITLDTLFKSRNSNDILRVRRLEKKEISNNSYSIPE